MLEFLINNSYEILSWYLFGFVFASIIYGKKQQIIKVEDLPLLSLLGGLGPLWLLIILLELVVKLYSRQKSRVLWMSRTEKTKKILYETEDIEVAPFPYNQD